MFNFWKPEVSYGKFETSCLYVPWNAICGKSESPNVLNSDMSLCFYLQIQNLEHEIQEKKKQMGVFEQRVVENGEASVANASFVEMQQVIQFSQKNYMLQFCDYVIE